VGALDACAEVTLVVRPGQDIASGEPAPDGLPFVFQQVISIDYDGERDLYTCFWRPDDQRYNGEPIINGSCFGLSETWLTKVVL
jgi:hypothetical protein